MSATKPEKLRAIRFVQCSATQCKRHQNDINDIIPTELSETQNTQTSADVWYIRSSWKLNPLWRNLRVKGFQIAHPIGLSNHIHQPAILRIKSEGLSSSLEILAIASKVTALLLGIRKDVIFNHKMPNMQAPKAQSQHPF